MSSKWIMVKKCNAKIVKKQFSKRKEVHRTNDFPACNELLDEAGVRHFLLALLKLAAFQLFILIQRTSVKFEMGRPFSLINHPNI